jgi:hypothetical protein
MARFRRQGASGLVSGKRGKQGNRRLPAIYTGHVLDLVREHYADFGPTLAREKLLERHGLLTVLNISGSRIADRTAQY